MSNPKYRMMDGYYTWQEIIDTALYYPAHTDIIIEKQMVPVPDGFTSRLGDLDGQIADYGLGLEDGRGIHVKEYDTCYLVHWDKKDPQKDPWGHLYHDAPHWLAVIIGVAAGSAAGIGYGVYRHYKNKKKNETVFLEQISVR